MTVLNVPSATLFYSDVELGPGQTFPSPLVRGTVNAKPTIVVVDTGAQVSVIDAKLAALAGLDVGEVAEGRDPSGAAIAMRSTQRPHLAIEGLGLVAERPSAVVALPPIFDQLGIGAIVSPQALAGGTRMIVLDLANHELRIADASRARHASNARRGWGELPSVDVCQFKDSGLDAKALVVPVTIDGTSAVVEIDTGASSTFVVADSDVGRMLGGRADGKRGQAMGAGGSIDVVRLGDVRVDTGSATWNAPITVMPGQKDAHCGYEGRIGIDRLRSCTLVIGETRATGRCPSGP